LLDLEEEQLKRLLEISRNYVFWTTAIGSNKPYVPNKVCQVEIKEDHPLLIALSDQAMSYLPETEDEYSIYNE